MRNLAVLVLLALVTILAGCAPEPAGHAGHGQPGPAAAKQLWTCGMHPQVLQDHPGKCPICHMELTPVSVGSAGDTAVTIDPVVVQNMGVRVAKATEAPLVQSLRAAGYLEEPEPGHLDVNLKVSGWIEKLHAAVDGMEVRAGDPLFELYSPDLYVAIEELIAARKAGGSKAGQTLLYAATRKLELLGLPVAQIEELGQLDHSPRTVTFASPVSGHVTERRVYSGAAVQEGELVLRLANRSRMWIDLQVYEPDLAWIRPGVAASATVSAAPGRTFQGAIAFIHPHLDPMTRTARVRLEVENADLVLRQGMYASVEISAEVAASALLVPREAVIDTGTRRIAFVALGGGRFEPRELELGLRDGDGRVQVLSGLSAGEDVVTSGQFLLDAESRIREAIQRHLEHGLVKPAGPAPVAPQPTAPPVPPKGSRAETPEAPQERVDAVFQAYLALARELGTVQSSESAVDGRALAKQGATLAEAATGPTREHALHVTREAEALASAPLAGQRERLKTLSDAAIALADRSPPSRAVADGLRVMHCPMAPGSWLQADDAVANPYYATTMKQCGEVVRTIEPRDGGDRQERQGR